MVSGQWVAGGKRLVMYAVKIFRHRKCSLMTESRQISIFFIFLSGA